LDLLTALIDTEKRAVDPLLNPFPWSGFTANGYPLIGFQQTLEADREVIPSTFEGYVRHAFQASGPVFACEYVRLSVFSEARFMYRQITNGEPGDLFSNKTLNILRKPWAGGTTGDLLSRVLVHADFAGNAFVLRTNGKLALLRPDWVDVILSVEDPDIDPIHDPESRVVGYMYHAGGRHRQRTPILYDVGEVSHFAPIPDPLARYRGQSWLTPVLREVAGDKQATVHKNKFYEKGATPNMIVKGQWTDPDLMRKWTDLFREKYEGSDNAYKSLVLGEGMDATVVGADFQQMDYRAIQGASETRIAAASGVGAVVAQLSEGLAGSSLNAGNYQAARRSAADKVFRPLWRQFCGSMEQIIPVPRNAELWYDERDISFLKEDLMDAAKIQNTRAQTIRQLVDGGYTAESVIAAVDNDDFSLLEHSGLFSVQLQPPGLSEGATNE